MKTPQSSRRQSGNVMIYILLALVLIGALTVAMTRQSGQGGDDLSYEQAELHASELVSYSLSAQNVINQMIMSGSEVNDLNFILPGVSGFDTAPHIHKVYHPQGGGLNFRPADPEIFTGTASTPPPGWYLGRFNNVQWTPTTATDVILTAFRIDKKVCESLNKKITGSSTIPALTGGIDASFIDSSHGGGGNSDVTTTVCPACEGRTALCVSNVGATQYGFYSILEGR